MARYTILKKNRTHVVVKIVGTGSVTIPLTDFKLPDETMVNAKATIRLMYWATPSASIECHVVIKRNNVILYDLSGNDEWDLAHHVGIVDDEQSDQPLVIEFNGDSGTMVMTLNKHGYNPPDTQAWDLDRNTLP